MLVKEFCCGGPLYITTQTVPYPIFLYLLLLVRAFGENRYCTRTAVLVETKCKLKVYLEMHWEALCLCLIIALEGRFCFWPHIIVGCPHFVFNNTVQCGRCTSQYNIERKVSTHRRIAWGFSTSLIMHPWTTLNVFISFTGIKCHNKFWEKKCIPVLQMFLNLFLRWVRRKLFIC